METGHKRERKEVQATGFNHSREHDAIQVAKYNITKPTLDVLSVQQGGPEIATEVQVGQWIPYKYRPLAHGQIRVLCLKPGAFSYPLHATLEHFDLQGSLSDYEAISYAWEKADLPCKLHVAETQMLRLTESLYAALQHFRRPDQVRRVWADAVCINQADLKERSDQVAIMGEVYGKALRVLVWLGPSQPQDALAFSAISVYPRLGEEMASEWFGALWELPLIALGDILAAMKGCECCGVRFATNSDLAVSGLLAALSLLQRPWFTRMWVLQEALSNRQNTMMCSGFHVVSFRHFRGIALLLDQLWRKNRNRLLAAENWGKSIRWTWERHQWLAEVFDEIRLVFRAYSTLRLLLSSSERQCLDARDRIFSIYSVLHLGELDRLRPDYSLSTAEVYRLFVLGCLKHEPVHPTAYVMSSEFFALVGTEINTTDNNNWPSWIPHFHHLTIRSEKKHDVHSEFGNSSRGQPNRHHKFTRAQHLDKWFIEEHDPRFFYTQGKLFAEVKSVLSDSAWPTASRPRSNDFRPLQLLDWYSRCRDFAKGELGNSHLGHQLMCLLTCSLSLPEGLRNTHQEIGYSQTAMKRMRKEQETTLEPSVQQLLPFYLHAEDTLLDVDRQLCCFDVNGKADLGWIPRSARVGDRMCVFGGCQYPFALRERKNGQFMLLGDAFMLKTKLRHALRSGSTGYRGPCGEGDEGEQDNIHVETEYGIQEQNTHGLSSWEADKPVHEDKDGAEWKSGSEHDAFVGSRDEDSWVNEDGGVGDIRDECDCECEERDNDWNAEDEEMRRLIAGLQWIALQ